MAYVPNSNSVVAFQSDATKLVATVSISGGFVNVVGSVSSASLPASVSGVGVFNVNHVGSGSILANLQNSSVAVLQGTNPWVVGNSSVTVMNAIPPHSVSGVGIFNVNPIGGGSVVAVLKDSSVAALQGTNPWVVQLTSGSVITIGGNSSVQVVGLMPPQSVSGVGTFNIDPQGAGSIIAKLINSSVTAYQGVTPWIVQPTSGSVIAFQLAGSIMAVEATVTTGPSSVQLLGGSNSIGSVTALQGTNPWMVQLTSGSVITTGGNSSVLVNNVLTGNSSVQVISGIGVIGSVAALQGTNPWRVGPSSVQLMDTSASIAVLVNRILQGVSSVQVIGGIGVIGSVAVLQSTNPWVVGNSSVLNLPGTNTIGSIAVLQAGTVPWPVVVSLSSIAGTYAEDVAHSTGERGLFTLGVRNDTVASFTSANLDYGPITTDSAGRTLIRPFAPVESSIFSHASLVSLGTGSGVASVVLFAAAGAGLRNYITDFSISNTGANTTLVSFIDNGGSILGKFIAPAGGGSNMPGLNSPLANIAVNDRVGLIMSASSSIVTVTAMGYRAP